MAADLAQFTERLEDYRATVHRCADDEVAATLGAILAARGIDRILVPSGFPAQYLPPVEVVPEPVTTAVLMRSAPC